MNLEDDSLLSDHLDDRLDPAERARIESEIDSDPVLKDRHRSLLRTKELVATLSRPSIPVDLTSAVLIRARSMPPRVSLRRIYRGSLWGAAAATILFAGLLAYYADLRPAVDAGPIPGSSIQFASNDSVFSGDGGSSFAPSDLISRPISPSEAVRPANRPLVAAESPEDRERLLSLLDRPNLHRVVVPIDALGHETLDRVDEVVRTKTRKESDYARFSLVQGLIVDPALPDRAELFVVVVDERERRELVASLAEAVPSLYAEEQLDPSVPALLADAGRVRILPGRSAAGLIDPPPLERFAAHKFHPDEPVVATIPNENPERRPRGPAGGAKSPKKGEETAAAAPPSDRKITLVLWVTRPPSPD